MCGGFQHKANNFLAAVMPVRRINLFKHVSFSVEVLFRRSTMGEHGMFISIRTDRVAQISV